MDSNPKFAVKLWNEPPTYSQRRTGTRRSSAIVGILGTLIVHSLVLQSVLFLGVHRHLVRKPDIQGGGAIQKRSEVTAEDPLILLNLPTVTMSKEPMDVDMASAGVAPQNRVITVMSGDSLPFVDIPDISNDDKSDAAIDSGDAAGQALLFGRYTGQIDARIERAWRRPRTPVAGDTAPIARDPQGPRASAARDDVFKCQVRIIQDSHGTVQEVQLINCNGGAVWRQSLVSAIFSSSPLPAPPSPKVFTSALMLTFEGRAYLSGDSSDEYETPETHVAQQ
jgi:hypothetical protein